MITLTVKAAEKIKEIAKEERIDNLSLRVKVIGGKCAGFSYDLYFDQSIAELDETFNQEGIILIIDPLSFQYIDGCEIDFIEKVSGSGFSFTNPNIKSSCGCGESFAV